MTLDLILFRPEFFFLFSFFVLLWYGTGNLVTPVAEILTVSTVRSNNAQNALAQLAIAGRGMAPIAGLSSGSEGYVQPEANKQYSTNQTRGPNHAVSALTLWAVIWCFLSF